MKIMNHHPIITREQRAAEEAELEAQREALTDMKRKMVARRMRGGANETQSWRLLREHLKNHYGDNLAMALHYDGFATEKQAYKFIAALQDK